VTRPWNIAVMVASRKLWSLRRPIFGKPIPYRRNTNFVDISALHRQHLEIRWHDFAVWAKTIDKTA
jgi:hypothetical protein